MLLSYLVGISARGVGLQRKDQDSADLGLLRVGLDGGWSGDMAQWEIERTLGRCNVPGKVFEEGDEFYTVLLEDGESFRRVDLSVDQWSGPPEGCFCHFKTRVPVKEKRKKLLVDDAMLENLFARLEDETEPLRVRFRFVLALILMRKRLLRYEQSIRRDGEEVWEMVLTRDKSSHSAVNPGLTDDQIEGVSEQLSAILHGDMGEWAKQREDSQVDPQDECCEECEDVAPGEGTTCESA